MNRAAILMSLMIAIALPSSASAQELIATYRAHLSARDHFSSKGVPLYNVAAILRQDRANYHKFGKRDAGDEWDSFFSSKSNRAKMERMLNRGKGTRFVRNKIINQTPHVTVKIYGRGRTGTRLRVVVH